MYCESSQTAVDLQQEEWPQGFDIRAKHAEQQELLEDAHTFSFSIENATTEESQAA